MMLSVSILWKCLLLNCLSIVLMWLNVLFSIGSSVCFLLVSLRLCGNCVNSV